MARGIRTWINYLSKKNIKRVYIYRYNFSTFNKRELDEYWSLNNKDNNFGSYLAGLFEGDGHIWIPKENMIKNVLAMKEENEIDILEYLIDIFILMEMVKYF